LLSPDARYISMSRSCGTLNNLKGIILSMLNIVESGVKTPKIKSNLSMFASNGDEHQLNS